VGEREKKTTARAGTMENAAMQTAVDTGKAVADISADERFYARSVRIRRLILEWMAQNVDERFDSLGEMEAQAANHAKASMVTARRWIFQFSQPGKPFWIQENPSFYIIRER
jgi:hypothetical protein